MPVSFATLSSVIFFANRAFLMRWPTGTFAPVFFLGILFPPLIIQAALIF
jgi:hypothetical protein